MVETILVTFIPAFLISLFLGFLYRKYKPMRELVDGMNEEKIQEKITRASNLDKGLLNSLFRHVGVHAHVSNVKVEQGGNCRVYVVETDSPQNLERLLTMESEMRSAIKVPTARLRKGSASGEKFIVELELGSQ